MFSRFKAWQVSFLKSVVVSDSSGIMNAMIKNISILGQL